MNKNNSKKSENFVQSDILRPRILFQATGFNFPGKFTGIKEIKNATVYRKASLVSNKFL